jgi:uncharacterized phage infection (PIP) family protein YhgE
MTGDFLGDLKAAARDNPVPAALIGLGAIWLLSGRAGWRPDGASLREAARSVQDVTRDYGEGLAGSAAAALRSGRRVASDIADRGTGYAGEIASQAGQFASQVAEKLPGASASAYGSLRETLGEVFERQPLVLGLVGVAVGASLAAALPPTELESNALGEASERVRSTLSELASSQAERATDLVGNIAEAAKSEAERQGLTPGALKSAASELTDKVAKVAESAGAAADRH